MKISIANEERSEGIRWKEIVVWMKYQTEDSMI